MAIIRNIPLALYIHTPWCKSKCPYCDFNSHRLPKEAPFKSYVATLIADLESNLDKLQGRKFSTIFIGGGTPSLLPPALIAELLTAIDPEPNIEITMETNPGTVDLKQLELLQQAGINRLSIGVQSFQDEKLKAIGRIHNSQTAQKAVEMAQAAGFKNINIDLMFGLPQQTLADALYDLNTGLDLDTNHLSWYQLTMEPNTPFYRHPPTLPAAEEIWDIQQHGQQLLAERGLEQYEVSAYSKPGKQCQHNLNYWQFGDYLGIGAGAHSKITDLNSSTIRRYNKAEKPELYMSDFSAEARTLTPQDIVTEFMMNRLRLFTPIATTQFCERTGLELNMISTQLEHAQSQGLLTWNQTTITLTDKGKNFLDELLLEFLPQS